MALAYAPARARGDWLALLALDSRLAGVVQGAREPMLAQIRLAWWRDRLRADPDTWPRGEPLLASLVAWGPRAQELAALADGWEALLGEPPLEAKVFHAFAGGRARALGALAGHLGAHTDAAERAGRQWALADLMLHLRDPAERATCASLLSGQPLPQMPRDMRPLAILAGLSMRAARRGGTIALDGPGALLSAIRLGIAGR